MPGFGKSGMLRILALSWSMGTAARRMKAEGGGASGGDPEPADAAGGRGGLDREVFDAGAGWTLGQRALDAGHRLDLAFDQGFDTAVRAVPDESGHALAHGRVLREVAEPDPLDAAGDDVMTGDDHASGAPILWDRHAA